MKKLLCLMLQLLVLLPLAAVPSSTGDVGRRIRGRCRGIRVA